MTTTSASAAVRNSTDGPQLCYFDDSSPAYSGVTNWPEAITVSVGNRTNVAVCANLSTQSTHTYDARKTPLSGSSGTCDYEENNHFRIMDPDSLRWTGVWPNNFSDRNPCKSLTNPDLYYYGHRFYSAEISRWLSRDPLGLGGGLNLYGFVGNEPLASVDWCGGSYFIITPEPADLKLNMNYDILNPQPLATWIQSEIEIMRVQLIAHLNNLPAEVGITYKWKYVDKGVVKTDFIGKDEFLLRLGQEKAEEKLTRGESSGKDIQEIIPFLAANHKNRWDSTVYTHHTAPGEAGQFFFGKVKYSDGVEAMDSVGTKVSQQVEPLVTMGTWLHVACMFAAEQWLVQESVQLDDQVLNGGLGYHVSDVIENQCTVEWRAVPLKRRSVLVQQGVVPPAP